MIRYSNHYNEGNDMILLLIDFFDLKWLKKTEKMDKEQDADQKQILYERLHSDLLSPTMMDN